MAVCMFHFLFHLLSLASEVNSIDTKGTEFVLAFCEHIPGKSIPTLTIINDNNIPATVYIYAPRAMNAARVKIITVQTSESIRLSGDLIQLGSSLRTLAVRIISDVEITVQGFNTALIKSVGAFLALPVHLLGTDYVAVAPSNAHKSLLMIVGIEKGTVVTVTFRITTHGEVRFEHETFRSGDILKRHIGRFDTLQLQSKGDLSSTYISSNTPVAVFSGADRGPKDNLIEQLPPSNLLGRYYVIPFLPDLVLGYKLQIIAIEDNTTIKFKSMSMSLHKFQSVVFNKNPQKVHTLTANHPVLVVTCDWIYKDLKVKNMYNGDVSSSVLYPIDKRSQDTGLQYRIRGRYPEGRHFLEDIWYMIVTDKNCDVRASSVVRKDPLSTYAVHGMYFPRLKGAAFNLEPPGTCTVFSGIQWLRGRKLGAMLPWSSSFVSEPS